MIEDFTSFTHFSTHHKTKNERCQFLIECALKYCRDNALLNISNEFPFYITSLLYPKYSEEIIDEMMKGEDQEKILKLKKIIKIINLLKSLVKNFSEAKLKKVLRLKEIRYLIMDFIRKVKLNMVEISGLVKENKAEDRKSIRNIIKYFSDVVNLINSNNKNGQGTTKKDKTIESSIQIKIKILRKDEKQITDVMSPT